MDGAKSIVGRSLLAETCRLMPFHNLVSPCLVRREAYTLLRSSFYIVVVDLKVDCKEIVWSDYMRMVSLTLKRMT